MSNQPWFPEQKPQPQAATPPWQPAPQPSYPQPVPSQLRQPYALPQQPTATLQAPPPCGPPATAPKQRRWPRRIVSGAAIVALGLGSGAAGAGLVTQHNAATGQVTTVTRVVQGSTSAPDWAATAAVVLPSTVSVSVTSRGGTAEGSGVIWDDAGHIVTNNHVVASTGSTSTITVTLADGTDLAATIVATDPAHDLAVLVLTSPPGNLVPIQLGSESTLEVGDPVMAVGNPLGLSETVTTGIVSALNRAVPTGQTTARGGGATSTTQAIQVSAPINPGNSGGALVDAEGRLVGINFSIAALTSDSGSIGLGFAIPVSEVRTVVTTLLTTSR